MVFGRSIFNENMGFIYISKHIPWHPKLSTQVFVSPTKLIEIMRMGKELRVTCPGARRGTAQGAADC